ncbi:RHS repeat protein [Amycolatopsis acidiphila]|nr:RHS repeat domain-containing protein [Amycolatopsis acidiphila]UIJ63816.1 RHS repeat protein [Amycolatopsis acidiphila]
MAGQLTSSTDARGQTLAYTYDNLGRKTAEYSGSTTGTKLASWVYDTVQKGKLTSSTRYTPQGNYLVGYGGYDGQGNPTNYTVQLPGLGNRAVRQPRDQLRMERHRTAGRHPARSRRRSARGMGLHPLRRPRQPRPA